jgi:anti-sigma factor RsiW
MSEETDRVLDEIVADRLPRHAAPRALVEQLRARHVSPPPRRRRWTTIAPLAAAAALAVGAGFLYVRAGARHDAEATARLVGEAVNDHLRVLYSEKPVEIASSESHQVKPWFQGKLDFSPPLGYAGDADFVLDGGAIGYFVDRKAAVLQFHRRLHRISLLIFRADGLRWPAHGIERLGRLHAVATQERGFSVVLWRDGELGYALVSDLNPSELAQLAERITP